MRCVYLFGLGCALSLAGLLGCGGDKSGDKKPEAKPATASATKPAAVTEAKPITVTMKSMSYDPKKPEVHVGDSVVWTNESHTRHTATSDDEGKTFDTGEIEPGKSSKPVKFEKEGEVQYHCLIHGKTMSGTIVAKAAEKGSIP